MNVLEVKNFDNNQFECFLKDGVDIEEINFTLIMSYNEKYLQSFDKLVVYESDQENNFSLVEDNER